MKKFCLRSLCVCAGLSVAPATVAQAEIQIPQIRSNPAEDPRLNALRKFFNRSDCPLGAVADIFVAEADSHNLDWRLLPSLAIIESSGGKNAKGNNIFGWANGHAAFPTLGAAIHHVARTLSLGKPYKNKTLLGILRTYNPADGYAQKVQFVMGRIAPVTLTASY